MRVDERHGHLVLAALGVDRQHGQVRALLVPVEGHEGGRRGDEVAMGAVAAQGEVADLETSKGESGGGSCKSGHLKEVDAVDCLIVVLF